MKDLDLLLNDWAEANEPTSAQLDSLRQRVLNEIGSAGSASPSPIISSISDHRTNSDSLNRGLRAVIVAFAAAVMVAFWISRFPQIVDNQLPIAPIDVVAANVGNQQSLFAELDRMFDRRWQWLSEINGRIHLQTSESNHTSNGPGVGVRFTVVRRRPGQDGWTVVWEASVLAHEGEWVRLSDELTGADSVSVWSHALPDGSVLIENDVALTNPVTLRFTEPHVFDHSSQPVRVWSARRADGDFQMIQSIARLEADHG